MKEQNELTTPRVIVFDVYETLLNMSPVEQRVDEMLGSKRGYLYWFELCMEYTFVNNCLDQFNDFSAIARATLQMAGEVFGKNITGQDADDVLHLLTHLPLQDGAEKCLSRLNDLHFRIAALTNIAENIVRERMERTGLISYFESVMSAESVRKYKPDRSVYHFAAQQLRMPIQEILLVSAHGWDISGAMNAGMQAVRLQRNKQVAFLLGQTPRWVCKNLTDIVEQCRAAVEANGYPPY